MKQLILLLPLLLLTPTIVHATTPYQKGYLGGIADGKADARDWGDACGQYFSTADSDACLAGYNLGFPQGCIGVNSKHDDYAEYMTCFDYLNATQK